MSIYKQIIATTRVDKYNSILAKSGLEQQVKKIKNGLIVPVNYGHDPRYGFHGRIIDAEVVELSDGHHGLEVVTEIFDDYNKIELLDNKFLLSFKQKPESRVNFDRLIRPNNTELEELESLGLQVGYTEKRSEIHVQILEFLTTIDWKNALAGSIVGMILPAGINKTHSVLNKIIKRRQGLNAELLVSIRMNVFQDNKTITVLINLSKPDVNLLDKLLTDDLDSLIKLIDFCLSNKDFGFIMLDYSNRGFGVTQLLRFDAAPIDPSNTKIFDLFDNISIKELRSLKRLKASEPAQNLNH